MEGPHQGHPGKGKEDEGCLALGLRQCGCRWRHLSHPQPFSKMLCLPTPTGNRGRLPCQGPEVWEQNGGLGDKGDKTFSGRAPLLGSWSLLTKHRAVPPSSPLLFSPLTLHTGLSVSDRNPLIPSSRPLPMLNPPTTCPLLMSSSPQILQDLDRCHLLQKELHSL